MGLTNRCGDFTDPLPHLLRARGYRASEPLGVWSPSRLLGTYRFRGEALHCSGQRAAAKPCAYGSFGDYRVDRLVGPGGDLLVVYSYYWHRDLWRAQLPFMKDDLRRNPGWISKNLKAIVDTGLVDAAAYLGDLGTPLREGMGTTICEMLRDAGGGRADEQTAADNLTGGLNEGQAATIERRDVEFSFI